MLRQTAAFALCALLAVFAATPASALSTLYLVEEQSGGDLLLEYDNGVLTTVGSIGFDDVRGLAYDAETDTLFGLSRQSNRLLTIDRTTGQGSVVANVDFLPSGSNMNEMSVDAEGQMFANGHLNDQTAVDSLFEVDKGVGTGTFIGTFGGEISMSGLAADHATGTLYASNFDGDLYTVDDTTGVATLLGPVTGTVGGAARIAFDQDSGVLYAITTADELVSIDLATLEATLVDQLSVAGQLYSLDFISAGAPTEATVSVVPPSTALPVTMRSDIVFMVETQGTILAETILVDGADVTGVVTSRCAVGTLLDGGQTRRCPNLIRPGGFLGVGSHTVTYTVDVDGTSFTTTSALEVLAATEP